MPGLKIAKNIGNLSKHKVLSRELEPDLQPIIHKLLIENEVLEDNEMDELWVILQFLCVSHSDTIFRVSPPELDEIPDGEELSPETDTNHNKAHSIEFIHTVVQLMKDDLCAPKEKELYIPKAMKDVYSTLPQFLLSPDITVDIKSKIIAIIELYWNKITLRTTSWIRLYTYLLQVTSNSEKNVLKVNIQRVWTFHQSLLQLDFASDGCQALVQMLSKLPQNKHYMKSNEGRKFVTLLFTTNKTLVKGLHASVKDALPNVKEVEAKAFGEIYTGAWLKASPEMRVVLEETCIQNLMLHGFTLMRQGIEMSKLGNHVVTILRCFHNNRKHPLLQRMLADCYEPLMWRYLSSPNSKHRCNAATIFFDAYPLQRPGLGAVARTLYEGKQHAAISELLSDPCHYVRIIAVREVCKLMQNYWNQLPDEWTKSWVKTLIEDSALDSSSSEIRRQVYIGFAFMAESVQNSQYLQNEIKKLKPQIHDISEPVRAAFFRLLIKLKECGQHYWQYIPLPHILARLEIEGKDIAPLIISLLFDQFLSPNKSDEVKIRRIMSMVLTNQGASRNFFYYSQKVLPLSDACGLIKFILVYVKNHVMQCLEQQNKLVDCSPAINVPISNNGKRRKKVDGKENVNTSNVRDSSEDKSNEDNKISVSDPLVAQGLIDIAAILWQIHSVTGKLTDTKEEETLYKLAVTCMAPFFHYYRDSEVYSSVLNLSSLMPVNIVSQSCHVPSIVMSQLLKLTTADSNETLLKYVHPLCQWNRGGDILDQAHDWLHDSFTADEVKTRKSRCKVKRVAFNIQDPKPQMALNFLDTVFTYPPNQYKILKSDYDKVLELWKELKMIQELIVDRLLCKSSLSNPLLTDAVLKGSFLRYAKLIPILKKDAPLFNPCQKYTTLLDWTQETLFMFVPSELPGNEEDTCLVVGMLQDLIDIGQQMIRIGDNDPVFCYRLAAFAKVLLTRTGCNVMFVTSAANLIDALYENVKEVDLVDDSRLLRIVIPSMLVAVLEAISEANINQETCMQYIENLPKVKNIITKVLLNYLKMYGTTSSLVQSIIGKFADILVVTHSKIKEKSDVVCLKDLSHIVNIFHSKPLLGNTVIQALGSRCKTTYNQDKSMLASCIEIISIFISSPGKLTEVILQESLKTAKEEDMKQPLV